MVARRPSRGRLASAERLIEDWEKGSSCIELRAATDAASAASPHESSKFVARRSGGLGGRLREIYASPAGNYSLLAGPSSTLASAMQGP
jgi:hypothetical protein